MQLGIMIFFVDGMGDKKIPSKTSSIVTGASKIGHPGHFLFVFDHHLSGQRGGRLWHSLTHRPCGAGLDETCLIHCYGLGRLTFQGLLVFFLSHTSWYVSSGAARIINKHTDRFGRYGFDVVLARRSWDTLRCLMLTTVIHNLKGQREPIPGRAW
jgi:hypothetical protein